MKLNVTKYGTSRTETCWIVELDGLVIGTMRKARDTRTDKHATSAHLVRGWDDEGNAVSEFVGTAWKLKDAVAAIVARHDHRDPAELAAMVARNPTPVH